MGYIKHEINYINIELLCHKVKLLTLKYSFLVWSILPGVYFL